MKINKTLLIFPILVLLLTVSFASAVGTAPDNADVEGYWTMENVTDSTNRNNLTLSGATVGVSNGIIDKAGYFDGADDWMSYSSADLGSSYSISVWVKLDDTSTYGVITAGAGRSSTGRYDGMIIINLGDFSFIGENGDSGVPTTTALSINTWYHIVGVADGLTRKIYLNSSLEGTSTESNNAKFDTTRFFGKRDDGRYLGGLIDEVTIFDTVLTSDEITFLYNEGTPTSDQQYPFGVNIDVPSITQNTYNHSTAINSTQEIVWRTNTSTPSWTYDATPTVRFDTNVSANCRLSTTDINYSSMNSSMNCSTTGTKSHVCSLWSALAKDSYLNNLYASCVNINNATKETVLSTSGALNISLGSFSLTGTTKNATGTIVPNASVIIMYQDNNTVFTNTTSDGSGIWNYDFTTADTSINYLIYGFDPLNSSRAAGIKHFVKVNT